MSDGSGGQEFRGRIISVRTEQVEQPDGRISAIEIARHPGGAAIVAINAQQQVCLLRQYRATISDWLWEIPAGKLDPGESFASTARRELVEEAGVDAGSWQSLGQVVPCAGFSDELIGLYLATDLQPCATAHEPEEYIEIHWLDLEQALSMIGDNTIQDAKTGIGLHRAWMILQARRD